MLNRIESTYLGLLRVVILIVATFALVGTVVAIISAGPPLLRLFGVGAPPPSNTGTLGEFISEKKLEGVQAADGTPIEPSVPENLNAAARNFRDYFARQGYERSAINLNGITNTLRQQMVQLPANEQDGYATSLKGLTEQLLKSKGKPLTPNRIDELLNWHRERYVADRQADVERKLADGIAFAERLRISAGAFLAFLLVVFVFLFVKVERSLRLVRTVRVNEDA